ncbi:hypothetical protein ElyMa_001500400 [Elysia marginata]|uniref:Uncharacterized protein n=1 Tax=Elysia marginata TaxID=1093978 RepID=A0AAV4J7W6_9GAST|nr:hypothetical protein ElyMa_001500400 [Elysia marginata]
MLPRPGLTLSRDIPPKLLTEPLYLRRNQHRLMNFSLSIVTTPASPACYHGAGKFRDAQRKGLDLSLGPIMRWLLPHLYYQCCDLGPVPRRSPAPTHGTTVIHLLQAYRGGGFSS